MKQEALKLALDWAEAHGEIVFASGGMSAVNKMNSWVAAIKEVLAKEKTLQALHSENERLGLYKDAYAQPKQEPVAYINVEKRRLEFAHEYVKWDTPTTIKLDKIPLYTHPPQRTWVDLTRTQIQDVYFEVLEEHRGGHQIQGQVAFGEALQAKLKEKNT